jgi:tetratricopeptide (TPR) repeat protein
MRYRALTVALLVAALLPASAFAKGFSLDLSPEARASMERGERALGDQDFQTAVHEFERVIGLAPGYPRVYHLYAFALRQQPDALRPAVDRFRKLAEANSDDPVYWYAYGRLEQDPAAREAAFKKTVELAPKEPWGHFGLAYVARTSNKLDKAVPLYEKAHAMAPSDPIIASGLVSVYVALDRKDEARKLAEEVLKVAPGSYAADSSFSSLAPAIPENERPAFAERYIAAFPTGMAIEQAYWIQLGELAKKDAAAASARAREVIGKLSGPRFAEFRGSIFEEYIVKHAVEKGQVAVDKLAVEMLASEERSPRVFLALGRALANGKADAALAVRVLNRGSELQKAMANASTEVGDELRFELGRAYVRAGDAMRGIGLLETITSGDNYGPAAAAAAEAHAKLGNTAKAYEALTRAVAVAPTTKHAAALAAAAKAAGRTRAEADAAVWAVRDATAKPAADFTLTSLEGKEVSLASYKGKVVLLNFWFPG